MVGAPASPEASDSNSHEHTNTIIQDSTFRKESGVSQLPIVYVSTNVNWADLDAIANEVFSAFASLQAETIGTGLMLFDKTLFKFLPRSNWFNSHLAQSLATIGDKRATFEGCHAGFYGLHGRTRFICEQVAQFSPKSAEETERAKIFLFQLTKIQTVIDEVAKIGLERLCQNYINLFKSSQAASLRALGADSTKLISKARKVLEGKLAPHVPNLKMDLDLKRYMLQAEPILKDRETNILHLRAVHWDMHRGVILPKELVADCLREQRLTCNKAVLKNAACLLKLATHATDIPTLGGKAVWRPMRIMSGSDDVSAYQELGVTGTCERDGLKSDNLCNLYYEVSPFTGNLMISCGAINTPRKAAQLALAMNLITSKLPPQNGRWAVHQLNSFFKEEKLIKGVHSNIALNEAFFQEVLRLPTLSFLHVNTCFNATTMFKKEDPQSTKQINIDALARITEFLLIDLKLLLTLQQFASLSEKNLDSKFEGALRLAGYIMKIKKEIQKLDGNNQFDKLTESMLIARESRENDKKASVVRTAEGAAASAETIELKSPASASNQPPASLLPENVVQEGDAVGVRSSSIAANSTVPPPSPFDAAVPKADAPSSSNPPNFPAMPSAPIATSVPPAEVAAGLSVPIFVIDQALSSVETNSSEDIASKNPPPPSASAPDKPAAKATLDVEDFINLDSPFAPETIRDIQALKKQLEQSQEELHRHLSTLAECANSCISNLEQQKLTHPSAALDKAILILRVYSLILGLQLKLKDTPPLTRSTEIELFLLLYRLLEIKPVLICYSGLDRSGEVRAMSDAFSQMEETFYQELLAKTTEKNAEDQTSSRIEALKKMYHLVINMDANRKELLLIFNQLKPQPKVITDLAQWEQAEKGQNVRAAFFEVIDRLYPPGSGTKNQDLKNTQYYLELVVAQLLKTEAEKTFNSSGAIGLKYLLDAPAPKNYFANTHVLDRWPTFISLEEGDESRTIKLIHYSEGWITTTFTTTQAANAILLRLSKLRGT